MITTNKQAPELKIAAWLNTDKPLSLAALRGRVVVLHAFQMLCPGCVSHGLPQATTIYNAFSKEDVAVIGIHTVFEHHAVMNSAALKVFLQEYKIRFPVAIDLPGDGDIPQTMQEYGMRGTPSLILIDRSGIVRLHHFGRLEDLRVGALIGQLLAEKSLIADAENGLTQEKEACNSNACAI